ncbi:protein of unknown function [Chryseobacterium wanjuense]|uniref:Protein FecR C-terminal domain-containing protein n=1 Tax=Chryseobacterium wanjuense TaxID=356305 RepID=A0A1I0QDD7_9FLAO|nr:FecR domain-containing protein [Chryseobacterium wanjuense]SEW25075.1 protein of unknown function [Chryseobacterium wanjuense]
MQYHKVIFFVIIVNLQVSVVHSQTKNLKETYPNTEKHYKSSADNTTCLLDDDHLYGYSDDSLRLVELSGRAVIHIEPGLKDFVISLSDHKIVIPANEKADIYINSRDFRLISAYLLTGHAYWIYPHHVYYLSQGTGIYLQQKVYHHDSTPHIFTEYKKWLEGVYLYDDITLEELADEMAGKYNIQIPIVDPPLKSQRICIGFENSTSLLKLLNRLSLILDIEYALDENNIIRFSVKNRKKDVGKSKIKSSAQ